MAGDLALFATPRARALVLGAAALLVFVRLGATDLWPPDEPRYALVAEELRTMEHGASGLVLLHLHGAPYSQKPPLFYWLAAAAGAPLGRVTEVAARLPSALAGLATVAATIAIGTLLFGRGAGTLAGLLLATTFDWSYRARTVQLDTLLALFETTAILAFWRIEAARRAAPGPPGHQAWRAAPAPSGSGRPSSARAVAIWCGSTLRSRSRCSPRDPSA